jgi:hypothetical protein
VTRLITIEILASKKGDECRVLEHLLSFADFQFGKGVTGKDYREREDGERISKVEIDFFYEIIRRMVNLYKRDNLISDLNCDDIIFPQVQEAAGVLISILIRKEDLFDAERYAQVTYGSLRDKKNGIDQKSEAVADGAYNLADVIY